MNTLCGIVGVVHRKVHVAPIIFDALKRLEYRGYDSVGVATVHDGCLFVKKDKGRVEEVDARLNLKCLPGYVGVGHTRWATHGHPSKENAHPHLDCEGEIAVVHNGIIENFLDLKDELGRKHKFTSETDTEVIPHLIEEFMKDGLDFPSAFKEAVRRLEGTYAIVVVTPFFNGVLCARSGSPLVIGLGADATYCASDIPAFLPYTRKVALLDDGCVSIVNYEGVIIEDLSKRKMLKPRIVEVPWSIEMACKGGYPHFMLKEIHEQPRALRETLTLSWQELDEPVEMVNAASHIYITGAGTSNHAGVAGKYMMARLASILAQPVLASEFQEATAGLLDSDSLVIAISQSGETSDTIDAVKYAKHMGAKVIAVTNVVGSSITRIADSVIYTRAGPEIGVAATKTFLTQLAVLALLAIKLGEVRGLLNSREAESLRESLHATPKRVSETIKNTESAIKVMAKQLSRKESCFFLGRGISTATAMEGALKLKEISYVHAEAYPAGESKHGPIALVSEGFPVVFIAPPDETKAKIIGNIMEMKARGAMIISLTQTGELEIKSLSDKTLLLPPSPPPFTPLTYTVPLQLFAYYMAVERGANPDKPRNLAKSVTVP
ncbi:MAG: glutamine--fructose-6-phosphate transaminase (isomerizing) [Candidatus Freyarchaeota archaeon]